MRIPPELEEEFPEHASLIEQPKQTNYAFGRLAASPQKPTNRAIQALPHRP